MCWFHSHYAKVDSAGGLEMEQLFNDITDAVPKPPRRMRITQYYSKQYYNTRIKPVFDAEWANALTSPGPEKPSRINILNTVTTRLWQNETSTFKTYLEQKRDEEHAKELEEHQKLVKEMEATPDSADSYHRYIYTPTPPPALNTYLPFTAPSAMLLAICSHLQT